MDLRNMISGVPQGRIEHFFTLLIYRDNFLTTSKSAAANKLINCLEIFYDQLILQDDQASVESWFCNWKLKLNNDKCAIKKISMSFVNTPLPIQVNVRTPNPV